MNLVKTYTLAALVVTLIFIVGQWLGGRPADAVAPTDTALIRRDIAAGQICGGQPFEWEDGSTLVCLREAQPQLAIAQAGAGRHAAIFFNDRSTSK